MRPHLTLVSAVAHRTHQLRGDRSDAGPLTCRRFQGSPRYQTRCVCSAPGHLSKVHFLPAEESAKAQVNTPPECRVDRDPDRPPVPPVTTRTFHPECHEPHVA